MHLKKDHTLIPRVAPDIIYVFPVKSIFFVIAHNFIHSTTPKPVACVLPFAPPQPTDFPVNTALLMTGAIGMASEGGEFAEIVKKCIFQGKPMDDETIFHCKRELGDIMWYWINSCRALDLDPNEVIAENVNKLKARYPGGEFDVYYSENREEGDL